MPTDQTTPKGTNGAPKNANRPAGSLGPKGPLLELNTLTPSEYVAIDDKRYAIKPLDSYGLRRRAELMALLKRVMELESLEPTAMSPADETEYEDHLRTLAAAILPTAPHAILAKLDAANLVTLVAGFFVWRGTTSPLQRALNQLTSERSSGVSPTATAPATGSSRPPSLS